MEIKSSDDFVKLRKQFSDWRKRFPMFEHDVRNIESIIDNHIKNHSIALVKYRQTHSKTHLEDAQKEIDNINRILSTVAKQELMALLSQA